MGIESTRDINRTNAIDRITTIIKHIEEANWVELHQIAKDEDSYFITDYVNTYNDIHKEYLKNNNLFISVSNWPNGYLEEFMDKPGVRYSIFENYMIISN